MLMGIEFKDTKRIPVGQLHEMFVKEQWCDNMDMDEVEFYIEKALQVVTAWQGDELVGFARLGGDGRIDVEITDVLVRSDYQGKGIGTELVSRLVEHIRRLDPYYIRVNPIGDREVHLYAKFGFIEIPDHRVMELPNPKLAEKIAAVRGRTADLQP